jgi:hypothetical protein
MMTTDTITSNGQPAICEIPGCQNRVHGHGLCRLHYDELRYLESSGLSPEAQAAAEREQRIQGELAHGCVSEWQSPHGTHSMFVDDDERRAAWEARRDELMARYVSPPYVGRRPWAWWEYEAERPQYLTEIDRSSDLATTTRQGHEREVESIGWMAKHSHLAAYEIESIAREAEEARERIGTDREHKAALSPNYGGDKLRVALREVVHTPSRRK